MSYAAVYASCKSAQRFVLLLLYFFQTTLVEGFQRKTGEQTKITTRNSSRKSRKPAKREKEGKEEKKSEKKLKDVTEEIKVKGDGERRDGERKDGERRDGDKKEERKDNYGVETTEIEISLSDDENSKK